MAMDENPLQAVSNVIELKPGHKYLLVFNGGISQTQLDHAMARLRASGIESVGLALIEGAELDVIEVPKEQAE
jgi:hypothetical protein